MCKMFLKKGLENNSSVRLVQLLISRCVIWGNFEIILWRFEFDNHDPQFERFNFLRFIHTDPRVLENLPHQNLLY